MPYFNTYKHLLETDIPPIEYLVGEIIPRGGLVFVVGPPASFKTNFLLYVSILGAEGKNIFDFEVKQPFRTLWIDEENREIGMKDKINKIRNGIEVESFDNSDYNYLTISQNFQLMNPQNIAQLKERITKFRELSWSD